MNNRKAQLSIRDIEQQLIMIRHRREVAFSDYAEAYEARHAARTHMAKRILDRSNEIIEEYERDLAKFRAAPRFGEL